MVLTGAGISAESGIKTFRDNGGLWEGHKLEQVATPEAFQKDPSKVQRFYNQRRSQLLKPDIRPNSAHLRLADIESEVGKMTIITQNVDNLHERAGSKNILHMHGELLKVRCTFCGHSQQWEDDLTTESLCPQCNRTAGLRPDIVWFGEIPKYMDQISELLTQCSHFISIGTSSQVYPAAGFIQLIKSENPHCVSIELNPQTTPMSELFDIRIEKKATLGIEEFIQLLKRP